MVTRVYLRQNITEDVRADIFDGSAPGAYLLRAAALLLEAIAYDVPGDLDASAVALLRDLGLAERDRSLYPALIRVAHGLFERRAGQGTTKATLVGEIAGLLGEVKRSAPTSRGPAWPGERLTDSETRVLRYLPTHLRAAEIAAELHLSANTVKTHLRHLYRKLGAHSRQEAVQRARAVGLLTGSSSRLRTPDGRIAVPRQPEAEARKLLESLEAVNNDPG